MMDMYNIYILLYYKRVRDNGLGLQCTTYTFTGGGIQIYSDGSDVKKKYKINKTEKTCRKPPAPAIAHLFRTSETQFNTMISSAIVISVFTIAAAVVDRSAVNQQRYIRSRPAGGPWLMGHTANGRTHKKPKPLR